MLPSAATPQRIDGVCALIRSFTPWRDVKPDADVDPPPLAEAAAASRFILGEASAASAAIDRFIGFGQGFAGHMLTFGQALVELAAMGDVKWAESCPRYGLCGAAGYVVNRGTSAAKAGSRNASQAAD